MKGEEGAATRFRRFIIRVADLLALLWVVVFTLGGALLGAAIGGVQDALGGGNGLRAFAGFFLGGGIAFCVAALVSAVIFLLSEIAHNSRHMVALLQGEQIRDAEATGHTYVNSPWSERSPSNHPLVLSERSARIIKNARNKGFEVEISADNGTVYVLKDRKIFTSCMTNWEIWIFGIRNKLL